eukprot:TRINITY_DN6324_c0_g1_i7.p1 TRINITY_DN6324_c0_g1~~TRINITY_DN6324_c0_g1_i7.p1  ORF type:complete len:504 (-),score=98.15 TRINITY_DN6324_c0_g1_i7:195-1706(-)
MSSYGYSELPSDCIRVILKFVDKSGLIPFSLVDKRSRILFIEHFNSTPDEPYKLARDYLNYASQIGSLNLMNWAKSMGCFLQEDAILFGAKSGRVEVVEWIIKRAKSLDMDAPESTSPFLKFEGAAYRSGSEEMIRWTLANRTIQFMHKNESKPRIDVAKHVFGAGLNVGNLKTIQFAFSMPDFEFHSPLYIKNVEVFNLIEEEIKKKAVKVEYILEGDLNLLKAAKDNGIKWKSDTCQNAAENGSTRTLIFALEHTEPFDKYKVDLCYSAMVGCKLDNLKYLRKEGCTWNSREILDLLWRSDEFNECDIFEMIKYGHEEGFPMNMSEIMHWAGSKGNINVLKWGLEKFGVEVLRTVGIGAANSGNIDSFKWIVAHGLDFKNDSSFIRHAASNGNLCIIKYLIDDLQYEGGKDHAGAIFRYASTVGSLRTIEYLRSKGFQFHWEFYSGAASTGRMHILKYIKENGYPYEWTIPRLPFHEIKRVKTWERQWKKEIDSENRCNIS